MTDKIAKTKYYKYAQDVLSGKILACKWVKLACQRFLDDFKNDKFYFSAAAANHIIEFYTHIKHIKGEWAGNPIILEPWEEFIVANLFGWKLGKAKNAPRRFRTAFISVGRKNGKSSLLSGLGLYCLFVDGEAGAEVYSAAALDINTNIPTPDGWKKINDIKLGDKLFDDNGCICKVTYVSPIYDNHECYEIIFDDSTHIIADAGHLWETTARRIYNGNNKSIKLPQLRCESGRKAVFSLHNKSYYVCKWDNPLKNELFNKKLNELLKEYPLRKSKTNIRTSKEIMESLLIHGGSKNHSIKLAQSLKTPDKNLPIDPYILGIWLGDGRSNGGQMVCDKKDIQIMKEVEKRNYEVTIMPHEKHLLRWTITGLRRRLRELNLLNNKHIPMDYLISSVSQRKQLLQGLMDTDGTCTKTGECRFCNTNINIVNGVYELVVSLGMKAHITKKAPSRTSEKDGYTRQPFYLVSFKAYNDNPVFCLQRKRDRQIKRKNQKLQNDCRYIKTMKQIPSVPVKCIQVDSPNHLFLCSNSMIPTHNTTREQARLIFDISKEMVRKSDLKNYISIFQYTLAIENTASKFCPLSSDYNSLDGLNISAALIDELHAHKTRDLYDVLLTATAARRQPLTISITTAGYDKHSICWEQNTHTEKVLERRYEDDTHFGIIYTLDEKDNWEDSNLWIKANPNLNISVKLDDLQGKGKNAKETPTQLNAFLRKHLNIWTESITRWVSSDKWDACAEAYTEEDLSGRLCYAGLDLSTTTDISALVLLFPPIAENEKYKILCRFWIPADNIQDRVRKDKVPYDVWTRQKYIVTTPGNVIDYSYILKQIDDDGKKFDLREIAFDRWGSTKIMNDLQAMGFEEETVKHAQRWLVDFGQGFASMSSPTKELEKLILSKQISHNKNPVLTWMISNVAIKQDPAGNVKPDKAASTDRIDGVVSLIMATDRASRNNNFNSVYDEKEILIL